MTWQPLTWISQMEHFKFSCKVDKSVYFEYGGNNWHCGGNMREHDRPQQTICLQKTKRLVRQN